MIMVMRMPISNWGILHLFNFNYDSASAKFKTAEETYRMLNDTWGIASAKLGLGKSALKSEQYNDAKTELGLALDLFKTIDDKLGQANANKELGQLYDALTEKNTAKTYYEAAIDLYDQMSETHALEKVKRLLSQQN